jgi:alpha-amylase
MSLFSAAAPYQGPTGLDSILHYPMYYALTEAFVIPGPQNMSAVVDMMNQSKQKFMVSHEYPSYVPPTISSIFFSQDTGLLGNFIENQDVPRWHNQSVDIQSL